MNKNRAIRFLLLTNVITAIMAGILFFHGDYPAKLLDRLGIKERELPTPMAVLGWDNCLKQMTHNDTDIVFLGDSLTYYHDFQNDFPDLNICNMGYPGDDLKGMAFRANAIQHLTPEKIFIMGGINGLKKYGIDKSINGYYDILKILKDDNPTAIIYVQSVLPVSTYMEDDYGKNSQIRTFNEKLKDMCDSMGGVQYIDIYPLYEENGYMKDEYTVDGIHLNSKDYNKWIECITPMITE